MRKILILPFLLFVIVLLSCEEDARSPVQSPADTLHTAPDDTIQDSNPNDTTRDFRDLVEQYERPDRTDWQKPGEVIELMGPLRNKTVAEIGAGTGYFTFRLVPQAEKVIAIDIDPRMIEFIKENAELLPEEYKDRLETRLVAPDDPRLAESEVDLILLANTYIYIEDRVRYFNRLRPSLKPGGLLFIVDFKKRHIPVGPPMEDKVALYQAEEELIRAGYEILLADDCTLPYQYILVAGAAEE